MKTPTGQTGMRGPVFGLGAAILFGLSTPFAKLLLPYTGALTLAGLLYLGAGLGLWVVEVFSGRLALGMGAREARLRKSDMGLLACVIAAGGIAGPVLMLWGLERLSAVAGALLLNLEAPFTIVLAVALFGEHLGGRGWLSALLIIGGAAALGAHGGDFRADWAGIAAIAAAGLSWGIDNNLTQCLSLRNPVTIVRIKALVAGTATLSLALGAGRAMPPAPIVGVALALGLVSYGFSIVLDVHALRHLGAAREAAYFATAPFVGALAAVPIVGERFGATDLIAAAVMAAGLVILLRERHEHLHHHETIEHDHAHFHDLHHRHPHSATEPAGEPHAHWHRHTPLSHAHPHVSDLHHRHRH